MANPPKLHSFWFLNVSLLQLTFLTLYNVFIFYFSLLLCLTQKIDFTARHTTAAILFSDRLFFFLFLSRVGTKYEFGNFVLLSSDLLFVLSNSLNYLFLILLKSMFCLIEAYGFVFFWGGGVFITFIMKIFFRFYDTFFSTHNYLLDLIVSKTFCLFFSFLNDL